MWKVAAINSASPQLVSHLWIAASSRSALLRHMHRGVARQVSRRESILALKAWRLYP
ncbi:MAG: hypothetical protein ACKESB_00145 [Candidatus Hodgkinia cicadicola]